MPVFNIAESEKKEVAKATFHKQSDYKAVKLTGSEETVLLHKIHADKLIKKGAAEAVKADVKESEPAMTVTKLDKE